MAYNDNIADVSLSLLLVVHKHKDSSYNLVNYARICSPECHLAILPQAPVHPLSLVGRSSLTLPGAFAHLGINLACSMSGFYLGCNIIYRLLCPPFGLCFTSSRFVLLITVKCWLHLSRGNKVSRGNKRPSRDKTKDSNRLK